MYEDTDEARGNWKGSSPGWIKTFKMYCLFVFWFAPEGTSKHPMPDSDLYYCFRAQRNHTKLKYNMWDKN